MKFSGQKIADLERKGFFFELDAGEGMLPTARIKLYPTEETDIYHAWDSVVGRLYNDFEVRGGKLIEVGRGNDFDTYWDRGIPNYVPRPSYWTFTVALGGNRWTTNEEIDAFIERVTAPPQ